MLVIGPETRASIVDVFDEAGREMTHQGVALSGEREKTGALVAQINREAQRRGLDVQVTTYSDKEERQTGADLGIGIYGRDQNGKRTAKGLIAQAKRDDAERPLPDGLRGLRKARGDLGRSQLDELREEEDASVIIVYGSNGPTAVPVRDLPDVHDPRAIREGARPLAKLIEDLIDCTLGAEGQLPVSQLTGIPVRLGPSVDPRVRHMVSFILPGW